ncbi:MAG: AI-2E family transporter [Ktedonobacteraceae bacterium]|nr:AI-2E family transporter [Ktedonobacteraceae bacterium]
MNRIDWQRTRDILISIICLFVVLWGILTALGHFVEIVVVLVLALVLAFLITPLVNWIERRHVPRWLATLLAYLVVLGVAGTFGYGLVLVLVQQAVSFSRTVTGFATALPNTLRSFVLFLQGRGVPLEYIQTAINRVQNQVYEFAGQLASNAVNVLLVLSNAFLNILLVLVISFYLVLDGRRIRNTMVSLVPRRWRSHLLLCEDALNHVAGGYVRGQLILALLIGCATALVCLATGLRSYALLCGLLAFLFETIPMIGPFLASITPIALSLLLPDPFPRTIVIVLCFIAIQLLESNILGPRIVGHAVGLHPIAAILTLLIGARLFGIFGALLATPIVGVAWVIVRSIYKAARETTTEEKEEEKKKSTSPPEM